MGGGSWSVFDHTADLGVEIVAPTLEEIYRTAACALFAQIVDPATVMPRLQREVRVTGTDHEELLVRWLAELLSVHDAEGLLFRDFAIEELSEGRLTGRARGEACDPQRHDLRGEIKAVTYHQISVRRDGSSWRARVILDV